MTVDREGLRKLAAALPPEAAVPVPRAWLLELLAGGEAPGVPPTAPEPVTGDLERLVGVVEAAARLGVSPRYVYRHAPEWPFTRKLGARTLRFVESGLEAWLAKRPRRAA